MDQDKNGAKPGEDQHGEDQIDNEAENDGANDGGDPAGNHGDRRRHLRFPLGLPVNIHVHGRPDPVSVQMVDIGAKGARFRLAYGLAPEDASAQATRKVTLDERAAFGFVSPGQHICVASGKVMRVAGDDEFVLSIDRANDAFHGFLGSLAG
jgi:hypothetical protein